jgi:two-component system, OmpR family, alkaline phosphatase synthesis response regulator PhoP
MKILIAEDDVHTRAGLCEILQTEGYQCVVAANGSEALALYASEKPDFVFLDIMMPEMDGYAACREIRKKDSTIPIIFISAKSEEIDKVLGLELGADDYIVKPFGVKEVVARVRAITRRLNASRPDVAFGETFIMDDLQIFPAELRARRGKKTLDLSPRDVKILRLLHDNAGKVLDRNFIFNEAWGMDYFPNSRTLDQHIAQLRKRIEADPKAPRIILTVHGAGYRYEGS